MTTEKVEPFPATCIWQWRTTLDLTPLSILADWYDQYDKGGRLGPLLRKLLADRGLSEPARFFLSAGYSSDGSEECVAEAELANAINHALAERWLKGSDYRPEWEQDLDYDPTGYDYPGVTEDGDVIERGWGCILRCQCMQCRIDRSMRYNNGRAYQHTGPSLWGITLKDDVEPREDPYCRVVEAELAMELMAELEIEA